MREILPVGQKFAMNLPDGSRLEGVVRESQPHPILPGAWLIAIMGKDWRMFLTFQDALHTEDADDVGVAIPPGPFGDMVKTIAGSIARTLDPRGPDGELVQAVSRLTGEKLPITGVGASLALTMCCQVCDMPMDRELMRRNALKNAPGWARLHYFFRFDAEHWEKYPFVVCSNKCAESFESTPEKYAPLHPR